MFKSEEVQFVSIPVFSNMHLLQEIKKLNSFAADYVRFIKPP